VLAVIVGALLLAWPGRSLIALGMLFGAFTLASGVFVLMTILFARGLRLWWTIGLEALVTLALGLATFVYPGAMAVVIYTAVGAWAVAIGATEIVTAVRLRRAIDGELWLALGGVLSLGFGALLFALPAVGLLPLAKLVGGYTIFLGALLLILSVRLHKTGRRDARRAPDPQAG
jgi:uncharacterized membrane protein HdeD (DUF308 family)